MRVVLQRVLAQWIPDMILFALVALVAPICSQCSRKIVHCMVQVVDLAVAVDKQDRDRFVVSPTLVANRVAVVQ